MVVVVEEHPISRDILVRLLEQATGGLVVGFEHWDDGFSAVLRSDVQAMVVSAGDDKGLGTDLIRRVRELPKANKIWIVATSTACYPATQPAALKDAGADSVLIKPNDFADLFDALRKGLTLTASNDIILLNSGLESAGLDFKECLMLETGDERACVAKDVIAIANYGGGKIIVGVAEPRSGEFHQVGIPVDELGNYETTVLVKAIRDFMQPHVAVECRSVTYKTKTFKVLNIPASKTVILAARENAKAGLFYGRIYSRNASAESGEIRTASEMRSLLDRILRVYERGS